jgi:hypothetical protein
MAASIPLTTTFIPAPSCLSDYYWISTSFISLGPPSSTGCFPSGWQSESQYFSPGLCPSGYVIACSTTTALGTFTETQATCCPSSYSCQKEDYFKFYSTEPCTRNYDAFPTTSTLSITSVANGTTTITPSVMTTGGVNAFGVSIRWQSTDFTTTTASPAVITITSVVTATEVLTENKTTTYSLTPGAAAGIGIGGTLILVAIIAVVAFLFLRHHRRSKLKAMNALQSRPQELASFRAQSELYAGDKTQMINVDGGMVHSPQGSGPVFSELQGQGWGSAPHI